MVRSKWGDGEDGRSGMESWHRFLRISCISVLVADALKCIRDDVIWLDNWFFPDTPDMARSGRGAAMARYHSRQSHPKACERVGHNPPGHRLPAARYPCRLPIKLGQLQWLRDNAVDFSTSVQGRLCVWEGPMS